MKRIAIVSDTHITGKSKQIPQALIDGIRGVDLIIHAGDINADYVIYELEEIAPVEAVAGNTDDDYIRNKFGRKKVIGIENSRIGVFHGDGSSGTTLERVKKKFQTEKIDCIVFGHSHIPYNEKIDDILYFNPGSPTDKRRQELFSYGILTVEGSSIKGEIKLFK
ncbi:MAG: phosphodiesterase, family [Clostridiales bacterium]|jgi:putative phosphoesterase|nr:phosphodiesterase, family [Clostridiales bacterium]